MSAPRILGPDDDRSTNRDVPGTTTDGLRAARRFAQWHLGDPDWANAILFAHFHPTQAMKELDEEMDE